MADFASAHLATLGELSGFIVCAKSPSCGMERVRLYDEKGNRGRKEGVGLFTGALMARYPWLPVEEGWPAARSAAAGEFCRARFRPA